MFGSTALEVAIGLALLFTLLSLVVTSIREAIEALLQTRAIHLEHGIRELLHDADGTRLTSDIYTHPYVSNLYRGTYDPATQLKSANWWIKLFNWHRASPDAWKRLKFRTDLPAYIPARNFALALLDRAARGPVGDTDLKTGPVTVDDLRAGIATIPVPEVRRALLIALDDAGNDIGRARLNVESWFDSSMDRVSGWYKKQTQWILLGLGIVLALVLNVDTLRIASALYQDDALRSVIVNEAEGVTQRQNAASASGHAIALADFGCPATSAGADSAEAARGATDCAKRQLGSLGYPIGWSGYHLDLPRPLTSGHEWGKRILQVPLGSVAGWLLTAFALSLGAPFWFDLLNKMMVIRSTVKPDEKSPPEASKDRQIDASRRQSDGEGAQDTAAAPASPQAPGTGT